MEEFRFHGRGGQGTVLASITLAKAFFEAGYWVQTFPVFGSERRGAPVEAYLRLDKSKIYIRSQVYTPDHVVVQDAELLKMMDVTKGLKKGGWILLNAPSLPDDLQRFDGFQLACIDASRIALELGLGSRTLPITNTAMMGAFSRVFDKPPLEHIASAIAAEMPAKIAENIAASRAAYDRAMVYGLVSGASIAQPSSLPLKEEA